MSEYTGGSVSYYRVKVQRPTSGGDAYEAELLEQIRRLSNDEIADKFEVRPNQVNQIWNGTAGMKL